MFMHDRWEELMADPRRDRETVQIARELADSMCAEIFDRMGLTAVADARSLRVSGRGLCYVFPLREDQNVPAGGGRKSCRKLPPST
jgi:hypothetical protein